MYINDIILLFFLFIIPYNADLIINTLCDLILIHVSTKDQLF